MKYDLKRANLANLFFLWVFSFILPITAFINGGMEYGLKSLAATMTTSIIVTIIHLLPINLIIKGEIIIITPMIASIALSILSGGVARMFNIYILALVMQALHFNFKRMMIFGIASSTGLISLYLINPSFLLNPGMGIDEFIPRIGVFICIFIVLALLSKWGQETIKKADNEAEKSKEALNKLNIIFDEIIKVSDELNIKSNVCSDNMSKNKNGTEEISRSMVELSKSVEAAAVAISQINESVHVSGDSVKDIFTIMAELKELFEKLSNNINESSSISNKMGEQMKIINTTAISSFTSIEDMSKRMGDVQSSLDGIASISSQTNLLALNASIEAAKAKEHGKGFAVVADEIRKLSEESGKFADNIGKVILDFITSTENAISKINTGKEAMEIGNKTISELNNVFSNMNKNFTNVNDELNKESELVQVLYNEFNKINDDISNIASILEENSAYFEEISSRTELQLELTQDVTSEVHQIAELGNGLNNMVNKI